MSYIDQSNYKDLLNKFAEGTQKQKLQENYVDLKPIGTFEGAITSLAPAYKEYDGMRSMEESDENIKHPGKYAGGPRKHFDKDGDGVPDGADKNPTDGSKKEEGLYGDGPMLTGPTGYKLENLTLEERKELKSYAQSMKTTRKAIEELLEKAKMRMEGGNNTELTMQ